MKLLRGNTKLPRMAMGISLALFALVFPRDVLAQGLPIEMGSPVPVALWVVGAVILGVVLAYGIARNRTRTPAEKKITDQATKDLYAREDRDAKG